ncbi:MAG: hypothetical protein RML92_01080 [Bacteroidia bacterium]|nr:hypothetical protein [Bacteroidia bacterium]
MKRFSFCTVAFIMSVWSCLFLGSFLLAQVTVTRISKEKAYQLGAPMSKVQLMPISGLQVRYSMAYDDIYERWDTLRTYIFTLNGEPVTVQERGFGEQTYRARPEGQTYLGNQRIVVFSDGGWEWGGNKIYYHPRKKPASYFIGLNPFLYRTGNRVYALPDLLVEKFSIFEIGADNQVRHYSVSLFPEEAQATLFSTPFAQDAWVGPGMFSYSVFGATNIWYVKDNPNCMILHIKERPEDVNSRLGIHSTLGGSTPIPKESFYLICWTARDMKAD